MRNKGPIFGLAALRAARGAAEFLVDFALFAGKVKWERREGSTPFWLTMVRPPAALRSKIFDFVSGKLQCKGSVVVN